MDRPLQKVLFGVFRQAGLKTAVEDENMYLPSEFKLSSNYPNPFNPETAIEFELPIISDVSLKIFNIKGQLVKTLILSKLTAGFQTQKWDGTNSFGQKVASGIYVYRLRAGKYVSTRKMLLIK